MGGGEGAHVLIPSEPPFAATTQTEPKHLPRPGVQLSLSSSWATLPSVLPTGDQQSSCILGLEFRTETCVREISHRHQPSTRALTHFLRLLQGWSLKTSVLRMLVSSWGPHRASTKTRGTGLLFYLLPSGPSTVLYIRWCSVFQE